MKHPDGYEDGSCVGCGHYPIWHMPESPPLCVRGQIVESEPAEADILRVMVALDPFFGTWDPIREAAEAAIKAFLRIT